MVNGVGFRKNEKAALLVIFSLVLISGCIGRREMSFINNYLYVNDTNGTFIVNGTLKVYEAVNATNVTIGDPWTFWETGGDLHLFEEGGDNWMIMRAGGEAEFTNNLTVYHNVTVSGYYEDITDNGNSGDIYLGASRDYINNYMAQFGTLYPCGISAYGDSLGEIPIIGMLDGSFGIGVAGLCNTSYAYCFGGVFVGAEQAVGLQAEACQQKAGGCDDTFPAFQSLGAMHIRYTERDPHTSSALIAMGGTNPDTAPAWIFYNGTGDYVEIYPGNFLFYGDGKFWAAHNFRWNDVNRSICVGTDNSGNHYSTTTFGWQAGNDNHGQYSTLIGHQAGEDNTADYVTAIGYDASGQNTGTHASAIGAFAGYNNSGGETTSLGYFAGHDNAGEDGTFAGPSAGRLNFGDYVIGIGNNAARDNTGDSLVAVGYHSGYGNKQERDTFVGAYSGNNNNAKSVTGIGWTALEDNTGDWSTCVGANCGQGNTGSQATGIGYSALDGNTAQLAIGVGVYAGKDNTGVHLTAIGYKAGEGNTEDGQFILHDQYYQDRPLIQGDFRYNYVGINTTTPIEPLNVEGTTNVTGNFTGDNYWGEMYLSGGKNGIQIPIAVVKTWYNLTSWTDQHGNGFYNTTAETIEPIVEGRYLVNYGASYENAGGNGDVFRTGIFVNGAIENACVTVNQLDASGNVDNVADTCVISLNQGDMVSLAWYNTNDADDPIVYEATVTLMRVSDIAT